MGELVKICPDCKEYKTRDAFYNSKMTKSGTERICKKCNNKRQLERYHKSKKQNKEKIAERNKRAYQKNRLISMIRRRLKNK